ncbi:SDR family NAD(P)-dependent oxidoreductase [Pyxidicoccus fallax]|uniref:SDR family NAD(P)-dependent oxidoreductase n=1 Tax=Pyxidicoccus fallax TaxID=394095 RepID=A0A848LIF2_9BACT|nr:SDR family NAD(P)-dependent oxidoreductase [Pyxidicoccus fallax]NMO17488.1 SDR family NAD(P)-dependent oxidoreductase [Pyxidicoccus fallax]NPC77717.1 SDR family NAD(P)-dependent oxidoreductase [Pyxidicoccus fallax]
MNFRGRWVLVTGASSGLGLEMARVLAREHGANILAVARREDRLLALRDELAPKYGVQVVPLIADLSQPGEPQRLFEAAVAGRDVYGVILNAGVTFFGHALEQSPEDFQKMLATNVSSLVELSRLFTGHLSARGTPGGIMLVSSMAGLSPLPYQTAYAATKAFVISYGRGLAFELRKTGVSVTVFAPGGIATEMLELSGLSRGFKAGDLGIMAADTCARLAVDAFARRRELYVPGALNRFLALAMKVLPQGFMIARSAGVYEGSLKPRP